MIDRPSPTLDTIWLGANFWSRAGGPDMWCDFDADVAVAELARVATAANGAGAAPERVAGPAGRAARR